MRIITKLTVPNVFTPNGDGSNDTFSIPLLELYPDYQLIVYSRWGQPVYQADNYRNGWTPPASPPAPTITVSSCAVTGSCSTGGWRW